MTVRPPTPADEPRWRELWGAYLTFYGHPLPEEVTAHTWRRLLGGADGFACHLAVTTDGEVVGFVHSVAQPGTWGLAPKVYLEDLFVDEGVRGGGTGAALIAAVVARARALGSDEVHWITDEGNARARRLYDHVARRSGYVRYEVLLD
ncbi:GNAT family N-acetyltransferase [Nitriliruptoraceae bacterium ZYF776]|nr:GNAT family N-acetyltransferase [Profundirhabdus halotolerans]